MFLGAQVQWEWPQWGPQRWEGRVEAGASGQGSPGCWCECVSTQKLLPTAANVSPLGALLLLSLWGVH